MKKAIYLFSFDGSYVGGAEKRYLRLFRSLQNEDNNLFLIINSTLYNSCFRDHILESNKNIIVIKSLFEKERDRNICKTNHKSSFNKKPSVLRQFIGKIKYYFKIWVDVFYVSKQVHSIIERYRLTNMYVIHSAGIYLEPYFRIFNIKYIYSENDNSLINVLKPEFKRWRSEYKPLKYAYKIDCLSPQIKKDLLQKGIIKDANKLLVTPNSFIDYQHFLPQQKEHIITFCSRLEEFKNAELLVETINTIGNKIKDYKVEIIGCGTKYNLLKELIQKYHLTDTIKLIGSVSTPSPYISKSKIFISIQQNNNYPSQSLLEAMSCENAIIASNVGETKLIISEKEGILVNLTTQSIGAAIIQLINNEDLCKNLASNARKKATTEQTLEKFTKYFQHIMNY